METLVEGILLPNDMTWLKAGPAADINPGFVLICLVAEVTKNGSKATFDGQHAFR